MIGRIAWIAIVSGWTLLPASGEPAGAETLPSAHPDEKVDRVLDRLEKAGDKVRAIQSDITFETFNTVLEDRIVKKGFLAYRKDEDQARFIVRFDNVAQGGVVSENTEWHLFDGRWYTEARRMTRQVVKREIVREGESINPFELGKGPFPLPFGQKKEDMLRMFDVGEAPSSRTPAGCVGLHCVPKPDTDLADQHRALDLYISTESDLPVEIVSDQTDDNRVTVRFLNLKINPDVPASVFQLPRETKGWDTEVEELPSAPAE